jgi:hypothetical protein
MRRSRAFDEESGKPRAAARPPRSAGGPVAAVLRLQRSAGNRSARAVLQRIEDDELEAARKTPEYKKALKKYNENLAYTSDQSVNTFDYLVGKAADVKDLVRLVDDEVAAASKRTAIKPPPVVPASPQLVGATSPASTTAVLQAPPPTQQPAKKKKNKTKKGTQLDPSVVFGKQPQKEQETVVERVDNATNQDVLNLIANRPPGATRVVGPPQVSVETVNFPLTVTLAVDRTQGYPRQRQYQLQIHLHPVPTTQNYLHVKLRAGTSPDNRVQPGNWLVDRAQLNAGLAAWDQAKPWNVSTLNPF